MESPLPGGAGSGYPPSTGKVVQQQRPLLRAVSLEAKKSHGVVTERMGDLSSEGSESNRDCIWLSINWFASCLALALSGFVAFGILGRYYLSGETISRSDGI